MFFYIFIKCLSWVDFERREHDKMKFSIGKKHHKNNQIDKELRDIKEAINKLGCIIKNKDFSCTNICKCNCGGDGATSALCIARSVCNSGQASTSVQIPPNACITKILASIQQTAAASRFAAITITPNVDLAQNIFCHRFLEDSQQGAEFDTTFVQPLCVGPAGATALVTAANSSANVTLTVIYCPNCCEEPGLQEESQQSEVLPGVGQQEGVLPNEVQSEVQSVVT